MMTTESKQHRSATVLKYIRSFIYYGKLNYP
jgi:hypothetical protein